VYLLIFDAFVLIGIVLHMHALYSLGLEDKVECEMESINDAVERIVVL